MGSPIQHPPSPGEIFQDVVGARLLNDLGQGPQPQPRGEDRVSKPCNPLASHRAAHGTTRFIDNVMEAQRSQVPGPWSPAKGQGRIQPRPDPLSSSHSFHGMRPPAITGPDLSHSCYTGPHAICQRARTPAPCRQAAHRALATETQSPLPGLAKRCGHHSSHCHHRSLLWMCCNGSRLHPTKQRGLPAPGSPCTDPIPYRPGSPPACAVGRCGGLQVRAAQGSALLRGSPALCCWVSLWSCSWRLSRVRSPSRYQRSAVFTPTPKIPVKSCLGDEHSVVRSKALTVNTDGHDCWQGQHCPGLPHSHARLSGSSSLPEATRCTHRQDSNP